MVHPVISPYRVLRIAESKEVPIISKMGSLEVRQRQGSCPLALLAATGSGLCASTCSLPDSHGAGIPGGQGLGFLGEDRQSLVRNVVPMDDHVVDMLVEPGII